MPRSICLLLSLSLLTLAGCGGGQESQSATGAASLSDEVMAEAQAIFTSRCVTCHGPQGKGDGPGSAGLNPAPRDLTTREWQDSVTDEHIEKIIIYGGTGVQMSAMMPPNPDLTSKPEIVTGLRVLVRDLEDK